MYLSINEVPCLVETMGNEFILCNLSGFPTSTQHLGIERFDDRMKRLE